MKIIHTILFIYFISMSYSYASDILTANDNTYSQSRLTKIAALEATIQELQSSVTHLQKELITANTSLLSLQTTMLSMLQNSHKHTKNEITALNSLTSKTRHSYPQHSGLVAGF